MALATLAMMADARRQRPVDRDSDVEKLLVDNTITCYVADDAGLRGEKKEHCDNVYETCKDYWLGKKDTEEDDTCHINPFFREAIVRIMGSPEPSAPPAPPTPYTIRKCIIRSSRDDNGKCHALKGDVRCPEVVKQCEDTDYSVPYERLIHSDAFLESIGPMCANNVNFLVRLSKCFRDPV
jgi:hypothetical protein